MTEREMREKFRRTFNNEPNFITPDALEYCNVGPFLFEISRGRNLRNTGYMYGVTVIRDGDPCERRPDLSQSFSTLNECYYYINGGKIQAEAVLEDLS